MLLPGAIKQRAAVSTPFKYIVKANCGGARFFKNGGPWNHLLGADDGLWDLGPGCRAA